MATVYSTEDSDNVHYLITQNDNKESVLGSLSNLRKGTYTVSLYTLKEDGLPLRQPAGFPQNLSITQGGTCICFTAY